jgi:limonene-1,2-epoxide hydrolase
LVVSVLALAAFLVSAVGVFAQTADPAAVLEQFLNARNNGDEAGAMALLADNISYVGGPVCTPVKPCVGKDLARTLVVEQFYQKFHAHLTIVGTPQVSGNQVTARVASTDDRTRAAGVDRILSDTVVVVNNGKITSWVATMDPTDSQTARFLAFQQAQAAPSPSKLPATGDGGPFTSLLFDAALAIGVLALGLVSRRALVRR